MRDLIARGKYEHVNLCFVALYMAVTALGLETMDDERARKHGFPPSKKRLSREWFSMALKALVMCGFYEKPTFEALRALFLISSFMVCQTDGNSTSSGLKMLSLALQLSYDMDLDKDPDVLEEKIDILEGEAASATRPLRS